MKRKTLDRLGYVAVFVSALMMCVAIVKSPLPDIKAETKPEVSFDYIVAQRKNEEFVMDTKNAQFVEPVPVENVEVAPRLYPAELFDLSEQEYSDLLRVVNAEAETESLTGQMAVVEIVANRVLSKKFPDTIIKCLSQGGQFTTWKTRNKHEIVQRNIDAVEGVRLESSSVLAPYIEEAKARGEISQEVVPTDYVFFCTPKAYKNRGKRYMHNVITIGGHVFGTQKN